MFELLESETELSPDHARPAVHANAAEAARALAFRGFTVLPGARTLLRHGNPVCIGGRAFDLLVVLLRSRGSVVTKDEITRHVWPSTFVDESNLRFQVKCLRKILGGDADMIKTIAGRGYLLVADPAASRRDFGMIEAYEARLVRPAGHSGRGPCTNGLGEGPRPDGATAELLEGFLRSAGLLVASYGSLEAFLGALAGRGR